VALKIGKPGSGRDGNKWNKEDHAEHLHAFVGLHDAPRQQTQFGEQDAVVCDYVVCLDDNFIGTDVLVFGVAIVPALLDAIDNDVVVATLGRGTAKPGQSPPYLLFDPNDDELARAQQWFDDYSTQTKSGKLILEPPSPNGANEPF
jgi:hypothetical protein